LISIYVCKYTFNTCRHETYQPDAFWYRSILPGVHHVILTNFTYTCTQYTCILRICIYIHWSCIYTNTYTHIRKWYILIYHYVCQYAYILPGVHHMPKLRAWVARWRLTLTNLLAGILGSFVETKLFCGNVGFLCDRCIGLFWREYRDLSMIRGAFAGMCRAIVGNWSLHMYISSKIW